MYSMNDFELELSWQAPLHHAKGSSQDTQRLLTPREGDCDG